MEVVVQPHERECAVCTNDFDTPKILPCGHLLCRECVISWMDSKSDAGCPLCTCPIVEHRRDSVQRSENVADALPTDSVMKAIVESARLLVKDEMCTVCDDVRAEYICMQCLEKMCQSCAKIHKKMVATRSHDVESLSTVTPERLAASRPALCADHGDKQAEVFCADHHLSICASCSCNKHRTCLFVKDINDQMNSAENTLCGLTDKLVQAECSLKQCTEQLGKRLQKVDDIEQEDMAQVDKTCDKIQNMVENCRKGLQKLIHDSSLQVKNSLLEVKRELDKRLGKVTSHRNIVTRARAVAPRPGLIHVTQALTDRVNSLDLNADLDQWSWMSSSKISVECYKELEKEIENKLHQFQQQQTQPKEQRSPEASVSFRETLLPVYSDQCVQEISCAVPFIDNQSSNWQNTKQTKYRTTHPLCRPPQVLSFWKLNVKEESSLTNEQPIQEDTMTYREKTTKAPLNPFVKESPRTNFTEEEMNREVENDQERPFHRKYKRKHRIFLEENSTKDLK